MISANDVFVVSEGDNFVTYQYKNVRVDEISPLASLYCDDVAYGRSPYLREVNMFYNGFMREFTQDFCCKFRVNFTQIFIKI